MQSLTILFSFIGLLSAGPQYFYRPSTFSLQPFVHFGRSYGGYQGGYGAIQYAAPAARYVNANVDIIAQTRSLADSVKTTLRQLAADPNSAVIVNKIINDKDNVCINSLEEGIAAIEQATSLLEKGGGDIKALIAKVKTFVDVTEPSMVLRESADILRIVEPLVKNISPDNPVICQASPDQVFGSLRSLALIVDELSTSNQLILPYSGRAQLKESANTISAVTTFITQLRSTFSRLENTCTADKQYNLDSISAIGDLMVHLADLFGSLGSAQTGENIRKGKAFVAKITAELNKIDNLGLGDLECGTPGDFTVAATTLEEVATLIDEIGLENLQEQLGINLPFTP